MHTLILLRHGESEWNGESRFTDWTDVDLTAKGRQQAKDAGRILRERGFDFDIAYTSVLKRAIRTLWIVLDDLDRMWIPVHNCWRLTNGTTVRCKASTRSIWKPSSDRIN